MLDSRFRPPVVLSTLRKSAIFFAAGPGSFKRLVICTGRTLASVSLDQQNSAQVSYISRIDAFQKVKDSVGGKLTFSLDGGACACLSAGTFGSDLAHLAAEAGAIHNRLLDNADEIADGPIEGEARGVVPG